MIRTQLQLTKQQYQRLRSWVSRLDKSIAQQVREAIDDYLQRLDRAEGKRIADIAGRFEPLPDAAQGIPEHDRLFSQAVQSPKKGRG